MSILDLSIYLIYTYAVFYYATRIFGTPLPKLTLMAIIFVVNSSLMLFIYYISPHGYEWLLMIVYWILIYTEVHIICKQPAISTLAATLCFSVNFFGTKTAVLGLKTINTGLQLSEYLSSSENVMKITIISFAFLVPYIAVSSFILIHKVVKYLFADLASLRLCCGLLGAVWINLFFSTGTIYQYTTDPNFNSLYQIRSGGLSLVSFVIIMVAVFIYSKLKEAAITFEKKSQAINEDSQTLEKLEEEAYFDYFTGFFIRSVVVDRLKELLEEKSYCYVLFIDLDGLKTVNDTIGHEEGDNYIKSVAEIIGRTFVGDVISRIGGDEFLIVGDVEKPNIKDRIENCYEQVANLNFSYETSISYGYIQVGKDNTLSPDKLIEQADNAMYEFKRSRNKERKN